ncbi:MAG: alpha/beta hydrolase [Steroidobacteraceae bacterium]|nr:alpha/beta hydrolase [Steroidobacteraceae bacterium]
MNDRRAFVGLCAATASSLATGAAGTCTPPYAGIMGRGYARGPYGLVHFHDNAGLAKPRAGELPLLLLHQSPSSARQFEAAFRPLARREVRCVAIDTPGFGFSDPTPSFPRVEDWASSFVAVMDHLGIERADVLGHHTGSLNATEVALQFPSRVRRLVLNGPFPITADERRQRIAAAEARHARDQPRLDGSHLQVSFETRLRMNGPEPDARVITRGVVDKYQALGPHSWGHDAAYRYDHAAALRRIAHPTLILTNTGDDIYELARRAAQLRPDFGYRELEGGTHDIVDQQPEAWCDAVVGYLRQPLPATPA